MATARNLGWLQRIKLDPPDEEGRVLFHLEFHGAKPPSPIEFWTTPEGAMGIMVMLQRQQAKHKLPIPANFHPRGHPSLSVVEDQDE
jgi:hypothetical protein